VLVSERIQIPEPSNQVKALEALLTERNKHLVEARNDLQNAMAERRQKKEVAERLRKFRAERRQVYEEARCRYDSFFSEIESQKADLAAKYAKIAQDRVLVLRVTRQFVKDADLHKERLRQVRGQGGLRPSACGICKEDAQLLLFRLNGAYIVCV
jgi:hypothetical protein